MHGHILVTSFPAAIFSAHNPATPLNNHRQFAGRRMVNPPLSGRPDPVWSD